MNEDEDRYLTREFFMKKSFFISSIIAIVLLLLGYFTENPQFYGSISLGIAIIAFLIGGLTSGAFVSGHQLMANIHTESKEDRSRRSKVTIVIGTFGLPLFLAGILLFLYF